MREGFRQVLHSLLKPLGALVVEELQAKLDPTPNFPLILCGQETLPGAPALSGVW